MDELREVSKTRFELPIACIHRMLRIRNFAEPVYLAAIIECQAAKVLITRPMFNQPSFKQ